MIERTALTIVMAAAVLAVLVAPIVIVFQLTFPDPRPLTIDTSVEGLPASDPVRFVP